MKTIDEYMKLPYRLELIPDEDEGGFVASFPELPGCLSCGATAEEAAANAADAMRAWMTAAVEEGIPIPVPHGLDDYSGQFKLRIPKSLHKSLAENARREGISMNQYCLYLLSSNNSKVNQQRN